MYGATIVPGNSKEAENNHGMEAAGMEHPFLDSPAGQMYNVRHLQVPKGPRGPIHFSFPRLDVSFDASSMGMRLAQ